MQRVFAEVKGTDEVIGMLQADGAVLAPVLSQEWIKAVSRAADQKVAGADEDRG